MSLVDPQDSEEYQLEWNHAAGVGKATVPQRHVEKILSLGDQVYKGLVATLSDSINNFDDHGVGILMFEGSCIIGRHDDLDPNSALAKLALEVLINRAIADGVIATDMRTQLLLRSLIKLNNLLNQHLILGSSNFMIKGPLLNNGVLDAAGHRARQQLNGAYCMNTSLFIFQGEAGVKGAEVPHPEGHIGYRVSVSKEPTLLFIGETPIDDNRPVGVFDTLEAIHSAPIPTANRNAVVGDYRLNETALALA